MVTDVKKALNQARLQGLTQVKLICITNLIIDTLHSCLVTKKPGWSHKLTFTRP